MPGLQDALNFAYKILERRALSEKTMRERLAKKKVAAQTIERVITKLKDVNLISDRALAENMAQSRVKNRLLGNVRIERDLIQRGIPRDIVQMAVREAGAEADSPTEEERAIRLAQKRASQISSKDPLSLKRRLFGYLARRGFDPETIEAALERHGGCGEKK